MNFETDISQMQIMLVSVNVSRGFNTLNSDGDMVVTWGGVHTKTAC